MKHSHSNCSPFLVNESQPSLWCLFLIFFAIYFLLSALSLTQFLNVCSASFLSIFSLCSLILPSRQYTCTENLPHGQFHIKAITSQPHPPPPSLKESWKCSSYLYPLNEGKISWKALQLIELKLICTHATIQDTRRSWLWESHTMIIPLLWTQNTLC